MMERPAISLRNVSKKYHLYGSPTHRVLEALHPFRRQYHREFWALRDITIDIPRGRTVGIIGRNGAGKSTLLQIVASVLRPTSGEVEVNGRVSALLELGAAFNPDFTGRQNVAFHCRLMGLSGKEIERRTPDIEAFANIGEYFDQPVKTYSSGMFVRVAFAVAISVEPDILVVDEALAVGDVAFQRKCFRKIEQFQQDGRTIVFVTHDVEMICRICDVGMLIENHRLLESGEPRGVVNRYIELLSSGDRPVAGAFSSTDVSQAGASGASPAPADALGPVDAFCAEAADADRCPTRPGHNPAEQRHGDRRAEIVDYLLVREEEAFPAVYRCGDKVSLYVKVRCRRDVPSFVSGFKIKTLEGLVLYATSSSRQHLPCRTLRAGTTVVHAYHFLLPLPGGHYFLDIGTGERISEHEDQATDKRFDLAQFTVQESRDFRGLVRLDCRAAELPVAGKAAESAETQSPSASANEKS